MLNQDAIFVNGLSRGGTTMLTNLLASHPNVCLVGETHHVFKGTSISDRPLDVLRKCLYHDAPIIFSQGEDFFSPRLLKPRKKLGRWAQRRIDWVFHQAKLRASHSKNPPFELSRTQEFPVETRPFRLLCKNIDGMIYANDAWAKMYTDATFFGLVRNGLAVCEGHVRRGRSASEIGWRYQQLVRKMLADAASLPRYRLVRFEDLLSTPDNVLQSCCAHAGLDYALITKVRMQARRVMDAAGNHRLHGAREWDVQWMHPNELQTYVQQDVDENQIRRLTTAQRDAFLQQAGEVMEELGYSTELDVSSPNNEPCLLPFVRRSSSGRPPIARAA